MTITVNSPITGSAQTGLTSPTYTTVADTAPAANIRQWAVTALDGTQSGVRPHSASAPFILRAQRPLVYKGLSPLGSNGILRSVPRNTLKLGVLKSVIPLADQAPVVAQLWLTWDVPAGTAEADANSLMAMASCLFGWVADQSAGIGDAARTGIL